MAVSQAVSAREAQLAQWIGGQLPEAGSLASMGGDAGGRRYYTLAGEPRWLAVDAPPQTENTAQFVYLAGVLTRQGLRVPAIKAADAERGFLLVENLGQQLLADAVAQDTAPVLYGEALFTLLALAQTPTADLDVPAFDRAFIQRELALFPQWFVSGLLGYTPTGPEQALLDRVFERLSDSALAQPQVLMHRDYHSRNILGNQSALAVIDFQDAVIGPVTYDAVSLLRDCYLKLPPEDVERWARAYGDMLIDAGLMPPSFAEGFVRAFDWMGLQRHLKVLGIFARLHLRDGKSGYLADLPRVLSYVREITGRYPEFAEFDAWLAECLAPRYRRASWYASEAAEKLAYRASAYGAAP